MFRVGKRVLLYTNEMTVQMEETTVVSTNDVLGSRTRNLRYHVLRNEPR